MNVGQVIFEQLKAMDKMAIWAWGSKDFLTGKVDGQHEGLMFSVTNCPKAKRGAKVQILLDEAQDLYNVRVIRVYRGQLKIDNELEGVYVEDLISVIDGMVG